MKKFGFGKSKDGDDDSNRSALFGSRSKKDKSPAPNPYAQQNQPDPYAQKSSGYGGIGPPKADVPPPYSGGEREQWRQDKTGVPQGGYGRGYGGSGSYGQSNGYGNNPYGSNQPTRGPGGYGGLGPADQGENDADRGALFGNAANRYQQQTPQQTQPQQSTVSGYGGDQGYGSYADRQLTQEEQEEEDIQATKQEIRFIKQQDVASTRNALRLANQAADVGQETLARLGAQGERIHNTERNLDLAANQNRIAEEKARELKKLNRSMFAVNASNPFTAKGRREARDQAIIDTHRKEREQRDATRSAAYDTHMRQDQYAKDLRGTGRPVGQKNLAERAKYQFEADSEDDEMENEIDSNLDQLHGAATRLKGLAGAMGREVDEQNKHIERIMGKTDKVDDQIAMNRARLDRIH